MRTAEAAGDRLNDPRAASAASTSALTAAKAVASTYSTAERDRLEIMRARNSELLAANTFTAVAASAICNQPLAISPVAAALTSIPRSRQQSQQSRAHDEALAASLGAL